MHFNAQAVFSREEELKETNKISDTLRILKGEIAFTSFQVRMQSQTQSSASTTVRDSMS